MITYTSWERRLKGKAATGTVTSSTHVIVSNERRAVKALKQQVVYLLVVLWGVVQTQKHITEIPDSLNLSSLKNVNEKGISKKTHLFLNPVSLEWRWATDGPHRPMGDFHLAHQIFFFFREADHHFTVFQSKPTCLCLETLAALRDYNTSRHYNALHKATVKMRIYWSHKYKNKKGLFTRSRTSQESALMFSFSLLNYSNCLFVSLYLNKQEYNSCTCI